MTPATITPPSGAAPAAPTPVSPPPALTAGWVPFRWTIAQYRELGKTGLCQGVKTMVIDGEIFTMVMPNPPHDTALGLVEEWLRTVLPRPPHPDPEGL